MIQFEGWGVPPGFISDGCTFSPDKPFGIDIKPACIMHDFHRRHGIMPVGDADSVFFRHLIHLGLPTGIARLYWVGSYILRPFFRNTEPMPPNWFKYRFKYLG